MTERLPTEAAEVESHLKAITLEEQYFEIRRREIESQAWWPVFSAGELAGPIPQRRDQIYRSDHAFITTRRLEGPVRKLSAKTILMVSSIHLPLDMSDRGIRNFFYDSEKKPETTRSMGMVGINEPGFPVFHPIRTEAFAQLDTTARGKELAVESLLAYLNNPEPFDTPDDVQTLDDDILRARQVINILEAEAFNRFQETLQN